jgi:predicted Zn-dependent protease
MLQRLMPLVAVLSLHFLLLPPVWAGTQAETLAKRAVAELQKGNVSLASQLANDAVTQSNTLDEKARATITLSLIEVKQGKTPNAQKRLATLIAQLPPSHPYASKAKQTLLVISQEKNAKAFQAPPQITSIASTTASNDYFSYAIDPQKIIRWNLKKMPLNIYIQDPPADLKSRLPDYKNFILKGISEWRKAEPLLAFRIVATEKESDVRVKWKKTLEHNRIGESPSVIVAGKLVLADLVLATHLPNGTPLDNATLYSTITHEFGHVLGIHGHSPHETDLMYWQTSTKQNGLSSKDVATLKRLYKTPATITNDPSTTMADSREDAKLLLTAQMMYDKGLYGEALGKLQALLKEAPKHKEANILTAYCQERLKNYEAAATHMERAVTVNDADTSHVYNLAYMTLRRAEKRGRSHTSYRGEIQKALHILKTIQPKAEASLQDGIQQSIRFCEFELGS